MRKITLALAGASVALTGLISAPAAAADFRGHDRGRFEQVQSRGQFHNRFPSSGRFTANNRFEGRNWNRGDRFDRRFATNYRVIDTPAYYHLRPAPYGYRWVQSGNDAVLVAIASGIIGSIIGNAF